MPMYQKLKIHILILGIYLTDTLVRNNVNVDIHCSIFFFNSKGLEINDIPIDWEVVMKLRFITFNGIPGTCYKDQAGLCIPIRNGLQVILGEKIRQQKMSSLNEYAFIYVICVYL